MVFRLLASPDAYSLPGFPAHPDLAKAATLVLAVVLCIALTAGISLTRDLIDSGWEWWQIGGCGVAFIATAAVLYGAIP